MEFTEGDYILGVWHASNLKGDDYMMTVRRKKDAKVFDFEYRFRYNVDDSGPFEGKDKKNFYTGLCKESESEESIVQKMNMMFAIIKIMYPLEAKFIEVKGDFKKFMYLLAQEPWCHIKKIMKEGENATK